MKQLDSTTFVSGQIAPDEIAALGVTTIVNNRPDAEEPCQPTSDALAAAARAAGVAYHHIPVSGGFSQPQVAQMADALTQATGPVLAFCRSGTRSAYLWALARTQLGDGAQDLTDRAAAAGYDLTPIRAYLAQG